MPKPPIITGANLFRSKVVLTPADIYALDTSSIFIAPAIPGKTLVPIAVIGRVTDYTGSYSVPSATSFLIYGSTFLGGNNLACGSNVIEAIFTNSVTAPGGPFTLDPTSNSAIGQFRNEPLYLASAGGIFTTGAAIAGTVGDSGAGYAPGDTGIILSGGATPGNYTVLTVDGGTGVLTVSVSGGDGFIVGDEYETEVLTGGGDENLRIDITSIAPSANFTLEIDVIYQPI